VGGVDLDVDMVVDLDGDSNVEVAFALPLYLSIRVLSQRLRER
jgi:hypothetical protein